MSKNHFKDSLSIFILTFVLIIGSWMPSSYAGSVDNARIIRTMLDKNHSNKVFIKVDNSTVSQPACHTNSSWSFVMSLTDPMDKEIYTALLTAAASGKNVKLVGNDLCDLYGNTETLRRIEVE